MSRLVKRMKAVAAEGRPALVVYLTFGDPSPAASAEVVEAAARAGADIIELGVPFSDPNADGLVIQEAMQRALAAGGSLSGALACATDLRKRGVDVPIVLFGYYNPIYVGGVARFAERASAAGIDAVLTVDLPVDELAELQVPLSKHDVAVIPLVAPTSTPARLARVKPLAPPFVYYISRTGVTGSEFQGAAGGAERVAAIRDATGAPVCVGFGIKTAADAARVGAFADGVVVGSAVVQRIAEAGPARAAEAVAGYVAELRSALQTARSSKPSR